MQDLVTIGERVGLEGNDLAEFVKEQQAIAREERLKEKEERDKERDDREKEREFELKKMELELKKIESKYSVRDSVHGNDDDDDDDDNGDDDDENNAGGEDVQIKKRPHSRTAVKGPKMPPFDDKDDMDSYLHRFERYAASVSYTHLTLPTRG